MSNIKQIFLSSLSKRKEALITASVSWVPLSIGIVLRRFIYRSIVSKIGRSVRIEPQVKLVNAFCLELGNKARLESYVRIRNIGPNRICVGDQAILNHGVQIKLHSGSAGSIEIGNRTAIGPYSILSGRHIKIGDDCLIAPHVGIFASSHVFTDTNRKIREQGQEYKGVIIEDDCWLGSGVKVLDGVTIGQGSIIGANAVVTKNIPPYSIAVGIPARIVKNRSRLSKPELCNLGLLEFDLPSS